MGTSDIGDIKIKVWIPRGICLIQYTTHTLLIPPILKANTQPPTFEYLGLLKYFFVAIVILYLNYQLINLRKI